MKKNKSVKTVDIDTQGITKNDCTTKTCEQTKKRAKKKYRQLELFPTVDNIPQWFNQ